MTEKYKLVCESGDYHIAKNNDILCYDLCSPTMAKENWNNVVSELNRLNDENEQLKRDMEHIQDSLWTTDRIRELQARNDRQAKQLDNLYHLIENEDWKTLKGIIQEFQECEEQLQREWKGYEELQE